MKTTQSEEKKAMLKGPRGFDEANYYLDETFEIGFKTNDNEIKKNALEVITKHRILTLADIKVLVHEGIVTLEGVVQGPEEKKEASFCIQQISGVKAVRNLLQF